MDAEKSVKEARRDFEKRVDEIRAQLREKGPDVIEKAQKSLEELREDMQNKFGEMREGFEEEHPGFKERREKFEGDVESGRREIREHPFLALGLALAFGVIVGSLLGRHKD